MQSDERNLRVRLPLPWCLLVIVCNTILWFKAEHPSHIIFQKNDLRPIVIEKRQKINSEGDCWQFISCCLGQSWPLFSTADQFCVGRPMVFFLPIGRQFVMSVVDLLRCDCFIRWFCQIQLRTTRNTLNIYRPSLAARWATSYACKPFSSIIWSEAHVVIHVIINE